MARTAQPRRVLLAYRRDVDTAGGAATVMRRTAEALAASGVEAEITFDAEPDTAGFDVVHAVNAWHPQTALEQVRHLAAQDAPVVWQPFFLGWSELAWAARALPVVLDPRRDPEEREELLAAFTAGTLTVEGFSRFAPNEIVPGAHAAWRETVDLADHIVVASAREAQTLAQAVGLRGTSFTITPHGVDAGAFATATPDAFRAHLGHDRPFALCVGAVDARKNQLMLAEAVRGTDIRVVLLGPAFEPQVLELVLAVGGPNVVHLERVAPELVASAYHAAAAHVLPSWSEGAALANLEAAAAGCPVVLSDRSSEFEYFGALGRFVDPADPGTIRRELEAAMRDRAEDPARLAGLRARAAELTWEETARTTLAAYAAALGARAGARRDGAAPAPRGPSQPLRRFTAALPWTRGPILDFVAGIAAATPAVTRVLDVGAGEAPYRELFAHASYTTTDWAQSVHPGARSADVIAPADALPLEDASFDLVLLTEVLEHVADPPAVLRELHRVLAPGGRLALTVPFVWPLHELPHDVWRPTSWGLHDVLRGAGFAEVGVDARNDALGTIAQLLADAGTLVGSRPDGRDPERAAAVGELRALAPRVAAHAALDARRDLPLGWAATARKAPVEARPRGPRPDGTRAFVTLVAVEEVLARPALLGEYAAHFGATDDATLALHAPRTVPAELEAALGRAVAAAGPGADDPDLLVLTEPATAAALAPGVDAVLSDRPPSRALAAVPHVRGEDVATLRALAGAATA